MTIRDLLPRLPAPDVLRERCRSFAVLDAVFEADYPTHTFTQEWGPARSDLAGMDNGSGDQYAIVFDPAGTFLYGFDHESAATPWRDEPRAHWPGLLDGLPASLAAYTREPAFLLDGFFDATVCAWYEAGSDRWSCGPVDFSDVQGLDPDDFDGAEYLFGLLVDGTTEAYVSFAEDYFELEVDSAAVAAVLSGHPLTPKIVTALNPGADFATIATAAAAMGYPVSGPPTEAPGRG